VANPCDDADVGGDVDPFDGVLAESAI